MDLVVPSVSDIRLVVRKLSQMQQGRCALGLSRSATVVAAWLISEVYTASVSKAVSLIKSQRPQVVLTSTHLQVLESLSQELQCQTSL